MYDSGFFFSLVETLKYVMSSTKMFSLLESGVSVLLSRNKDLRNGL